LIGPDLQVAFLTFIKAGGPALLPNIFIKERKDEE
jgi:hypothetical protein